MRCWEAILFDFDGVLIDSEPLHFACWREVFRQFGVAADWETYARHCIGIADREVVEFFCLRMRPPRPVEPVWAQYGRKKALFQECIRAGVPVPAATMELLRSGLAGYKLAVVSSSARREVEPVLEASGIRPYFDCVVCGEDVENLKPAPDPYLLAARQLGVASALVVEDSEAGLASGRAAGFDVLYVPSVERTAGLLLARLNENEIRARSRPAARG